jgi:hypothetical protein
VSTLSLIDANAILLRKRYHNVDDHTELGVMYGLARGDNGKNYLHVTRPFQIRHLRTQWRTSSREVVGETTMTPEFIEFEGIISPYAPLYSCSHSDERQKLLTNDEMHTIMKTGAKTLSETYSTIYVLGCQLRKL